MSTISDQLAFSSSYQEAKALYAKKPSALPPFISIFFQFPVESYIQPNKNVSLFNISNGNIRYTDMTEEDKAYIILEEVDRISRTVLNEIQKTKKLVKLTYQTQVHDGFSYCFKYPAMIEQLVRWRFLELAQTTLHESIAVPFTVSVSKGCFNTDKVTITAQLNLESSH